MSYHYSKRSTERLGTCHRDLQTIFREVIKYVDVSIICGHREEDAQNKAYAEGNSNRHWPNSKHNSFPSLAVDVVPYPVDWNDMNRFYELHGVIVVIAEQMRIPIIWGGHWQNLIDLPHYELVRDL